MKQKKVELKFQIKRSVRKNIIKKFNFTKLICTPAMMSKIGKLGKSFRSKRINAKPKIRHGNK